jgi:hypothetical protein
MESLLGNFSDSGAEEQHFELLQDLEKQTSEEIRKQRACERIAVKAKVILQSGNSSELLSYKLQGVTGDVSEGGCRAMFPIPIKVGDVYRLRFQLESLDTHLVFARCKRCQLIREDAYEAGFSFFNPIKIPQTVDPVVNNELL